MSFNSDVKNELCEAVISQQLSDIFRYGLMYGMNSDKPTAVTEFKCVERCYSELFGGNAIIEHIVRRKIPCYKITVSGNDELSGSIINRSLVSGNDVDTGVFLRGVFLGCGSVSVQKAGYHLELSVHSEEKCEQLYRLIHEQGMKINRSSRRGIPFLYTKDSENITDFLTFIGAMQSAMEIMNIKIYKGFRSNINRQVNCEAANIGKTVAASARQLEDIRCITEYGEYEKLPAELKEMASLRTENPDVSLSELGAMLDPPISRSGVNHRLERIKKIAEALREKNGLIAH